MISDNNRKQISDYNFSDFVSIIKNNIIIFTISFVFFIALPIILSWEFKKRTFDTYNIYGNLFKETFTC